MASLKTSFFRFREHTTLSPMHMSCVNPKAETGNLYSVAICCWQWHRVLVWAELCTKILSSKNYMLLIVDSYWQQPSWDFSGMYCWEMIYPFLLLVVLCMSKAAQLARYTTSSVTDSLRNPSWPLSSMVILPGVPTERDISFPSR